MRLSVRLICVAVIVVASSNAALSQAYAPTPLSADAIVSKMVAAAGRLEGGSYLISERQSNGDGTITERTIQIDGADFLALEQTGSLTIEYGRYRGEAWYRDPNGSVIEERDESIDDSSAEIAWIQDQSAHTAVRVLGVTQMQPQQYVLAFKSSSGSDVTAYVDAQTNLLSRVEYSSGSAHSEAEYSDYHTVFGATIAFDERNSETNYPQNGNSVRITAWTENPTNDAVMAVPQSQPLFAVPTQMTLPASFTYQDGSTGDIVLHARINGQDVDLILDSGATDFVLDPGAASRLGLTVTGKQRSWIGGPLDESQTVAPEMTIGNLAMHNVAFTVLPVDVNEEGAHSAGLLGCDFFESAIVGIDLKDQTLTLYPRATFDPSALGVVAVPIRTNSCVAEAAGMFEGVRNTFLIDTGADTTLLNHSYLMQLPHAQRESDTSSIFSSVGYIRFLGGAVATHTYVIDDFVFAGVQFRTGEVDVPDVDVIEGDGGIIGRNVLRVFKVYFDYADGLAFFKLNA